MKLPPRQFQDPFPSTITLNSKLYEFVISTKSGGNWALSVSDAISANIPRANLFISLQILSNVLL